MAGQGSARVNLNEIDLSQVKNPQQLPQGVPAAVVGTSRKGPAFVPRTFANTQQFEEVFGSMKEKGKHSNINRLGPLGLQEWLNSSRSGTFLRVLGVGDGTKSASGAGFVVGAPQVHKQTASLGKVTQNPYAAGSANGTVKMLGCFMVDVGAGTFLEDTTGVNTAVSAVPVIRGVLMTPQGVVAALNPNPDVAAFLDADPTVDDSKIRKSPDGKLFGTDEDDNLVGYDIGQVDLVNQGFKIILNGFTNPLKPAVLDCSFDPSSDSYISKVLNTDPAKIEECGHYLYAWWDIESDVAVPSQQGLQRGGVDLGEGAATAYNKMVGFLLEGESDFTNFQSRYQTAKTPWIVSQKYGTKTYNLFRLHALDDGEAGNNQFRLLVSNLSYVKDSLYGSFTLTLEKFDSDPVRGEVLASWSNLSLDPSSNNYIARVLGDKHTYFDFDSDVDKQRLIVEGDFDIKNNFVRVELSKDLIAGNVPIDALPTGFLNHPWLRTQGTDGSAFGENPTYTNGRIYLDANNDPVHYLDKTQVSPLKFVQTISRVINSTSNEASDELAWGVKLAKKESGALRQELGEITFDKSIMSFTKFFLGGVGGVLVEDDGSSTALENQHGRFSLENIAATITNDVIDWSTAEYKYDSTGNIVISQHAKGRDSKYLKFRCLFQGGFDGVNIFDKEKAELTNVAAMREAADEGDKKVYTGPTISAYQKAVEVLSDKSAVEFQVLAIPGQRESVITNFALSACESRFDALYLMDIVEYDELGIPIESDAVKPHVKNTVEKFESRSLDSSFGAAYFPDITLRLAGGINKSVPPTVGLLGVLSRSDRVSAPWFAPAGLSRGRLTARSVDVKMSRDLLDSVYDADINPIYEPAGRSGEVYVFGQKTLLQDESALDRINVRRLLIDIRRKVKAIGETLLFEPNRESTLARFSSLVEPIMQDVQRRRGVSRYKVQIDTTTTTQNDVENNTVRGKIYLQPIKSVEFISLDFVVTNTIQ